MKMVADNFANKILKLAVDGAVGGDQRLEQVGWMLFLKVYDYRECQWNQDSIMAKKRVEESPDELQNVKKAVLNFQRIIPKPLRWHNWVPRALAKKGGDVTPMTNEELMHFVNDELFPGLRELPVVEEGTPEQPRTPRSQACVKLIFEKIEQRIRDPRTLRKMLALVDAIDVDTKEDRHALSAEMDSLLWDSTDLYTPRALMDFMMRCLNPYPGDHMTDFAVGAGACGSMVAAARQLSWRINKNPKYTTNDQRVQALNKVRQDIFGVGSNPVGYLLGVTHLFLSDFKVPKVYLGDVLDNPVDSKDFGSFKVITMRTPFKGTVNPDDLKNFPEELRSQHYEDLLVALATYRLKKDGRAAIIVPDRFLTDTTPETVAIRRRIVEDFHLRFVFRLPDTTLAQTAKKVPASILVFDDKEVESETWFYRIELPEGYRAFTKTKPIQREHLKDVDRWCIEWRKRKNEPPADESPAETSGNVKKLSREEIAANGYRLDYCNFEKKKA